ncbi:MAG: RagB/SusD family nutrient uptake outer membrane protein [Bacteroidota bacterium]|nr:RagB/SusD family nutrient uptake outer membrane protein [Bacteroidota bacterium]
MKQKNYILLLLFCGILFSCDSYLNVVPDNIATIDNAFTDKYNAEKYLFTCYSFLPDFASVDENPALSSGDDVAYSGAHLGSNGPEMARGHQNVTKPYFDFWRGGIFIAIRDCNTFLDNIDKVRDLDLSQKKEWIAEVNCLKAYYHFYLLRMYGPIPIMDKSMPVSSSTTAIKVVREPVDDCFAYIVNLLDKSIVDLPELLRIPSSDLGRITKPIAMAIKAEVLMTAASPLFNGNQVHSTLRNKDGKALFNSVYDPKKWEKAAVACKEAITEAEATKVSLYQKSDFKTYYNMNDTIMQIASLRSSISEPWNKELIWGSTQSGSTDIQTKSSPRWYPYTQNASYSNHAPTLKVAEEFYTKNGVPINEDVTWDFSKRYDLRTATDKEWMYVEPGEETAALNYDREPRYYSSISFDRGAWFGNGSQEVPIEKPWYIHNRKDEFASIFELNMYSYTGMYAKKLVNLNCQVRDGQTYIFEKYAFPIIRLADLYLYYTEALNETKAAPDAEVYSYIDKVRERAGLKGVVESWRNYSVFPDKPSTKSGMREIIQRERLIELAFEGHRYWDLRRWMLAKKYESAPVLGWNVFKNNSLEYYRMSNLYNRTFSDRDYFWPIPEDEIVKNTNLVQNLGW